MTIKLLVPPEKTPFELLPSMEIGSGGEGTIYLLQQTSAAKVYHDSYRDRIHQEKVLAICSVYDNYKGILDDTVFAFPRVPGTDANTKQLVGFEMAFMGKYPTLEEMKFSLSSGSFPTVTDSGSFSDSEAIALIYELFISLDKLADARIVLGDVNPRNILYDYNRKTPLFIDLDSAQIASHGCRVFSADYLDPVVENSGVNSDGTLKGTIDGDIFGMAVVAYELLIGQRPFELRCVPPNDATYRKNSGISLLGHHNDSSYLATRGVDLINAEINKKHLKRLDALATIDNRLYTFFLNTLLHGHRQSLIYLLPPDDSRNPNSIFSNESSVARTVAQRIKDGWDVKKTREDEIRKKLASLKVFGGQQTTNVVVKRIFRVIGMQQDLTSKVDPPGFSHFVGNMGFTYQDLIAP